MKRIAARVRHDLTDAQWRVLRWALWPLLQVRGSSTLRRWHRDLSARDVFGAPQAGEASERLKQCTAVCEDYAERVFTALHGGDGMDLR